MCCSWTASRIALDWQHCVIHDKKLTTLEGLKYFLLCLLWQHSSWNVFGHYVADLACSALSWLLQILPISSASMLGSHVWKTRSEERMEVKFAGVPSHSAGFWPQLSSEHDLNSQWLGASWSTERRHWLMQIGQQPTGIRAWLHNESAKNRFQRMETD